jgi:hypothetical protein
MFSFFSPRLQMREANAAAIQWLLLYAVLAATGLRVGESPPDAVAGLSHNSDKTCFAEVQSARRPGFLVCFIAGPPPHTVRSRRNPTTPD